MIKIAICEDDREDCLHIRNLLEEYAEKSGFQYSLSLFESGEQFLSSGFVPDILFLDIMMNEKDGIQVGEELGKNRTNILIIYTTNLSEKIIVALNRIHSFGYLIKPIDREAFDQMMSDAIREVQDNLPVDTVTFLSEDNTIIHLPVTDIYYFEYFERKIKIVAKDRTYVCIKEKIGAIAEKMEKYGFAMSHQSFVVNLYYVDKISYQTLLMKNGDEVYLAQKRTASLKKRLMQVAKELTCHGGSRNACE